MTRSRKTVQMAEIALMSAVLCIVSPFSVPVPMSPVPFSLSLFAVYLTAVILGAKQGTVCVLIYLLLGMVGLPVFSGFSGGIGVLFGPTGGYLAGYLSCVLITGWMTNTKKGNGSFLQNMGAMTLGTGTCYFFGTIWFLAVLDGSYSVVQALALCVVPYLIFDLIKILAAAAVVVPIKKMLRRMKQ